MAETLVAETKLSGESDPVPVSGANMPYSFHAAPPLESGETANIQFLGGNGTFYPLWLDGFRVQLDTTRRIQTIYGPGIYRVVKEATSGPTGIYGSSEANN